MFPRSKHTPSGSIHGHQITGELRSLRSINHAWRCVCRTVDLGYKQMLIVAGGHFDAYTQDFEIAQSEAIQWSVPYLQTSAMLQRIRGECR